MGMEIRNWLQYVPVPVPAANNGNWFLFTLRMILATRKSKKEKGWVTIQDIFRLGGVPNQCYSFNASFYVCNNNMPLMSCIFNRMLDPIPFVDSFAVWFQSANQLPLTMMFTHPNLYSTSLALPALNPSSSLFIIIFKVILTRCISYNS